MEPSRANQNSWVSKAEAAAAKSLANGNSSWLNWRRILEAVLLSCIILIVWGLFSVPTILYVLPPLQVSTTVVYEYLHELSTTCIMSSTYIQNSVSSTSNTVTPINISNLCTGM